MRTQLPADYTIDYDRHFNAYLEKPEAITSIPTETELMELAHKAIVRDQLVLAPVPMREAALTGDPAVLKVNSVIPRFNKERVTATLGRGLYSRELEDAVIGLKAGDRVNVTINGEPVEVLVLELKRKQVPQPTDEMVVAMEVKSADGKPLKTVREYEDYIRDEKVMTVLAEINYYVASAIMEELPEIVWSEEDSRVLGELEKEYFIKLFLETEKTDLREGIPESWKLDGIETLDDFINARREWYEIKIKQCLMFLSILGLPCEGATDPLDHYEVLQELQLKIFDLIKDKLERR